MASSPLAQPLGETDSTISLPSISHYSYDHHHHHRYDSPVIYITENGCSGQSVLSTIHLLLTWVVVVVVVVVVGVVVDGVDASL